MCSHSFQVLFIFTTPVQFLHLPVGRALLTYLYFVMYFLYIKKASCNLVVTLELICLLKSGVDLILVAQNSKQDFNFENF